MFRLSTKLRGLMLCASVAALITATQAFAQNASGAAPATQAAATESAVGNLLQGLVNKKVLSRKDAQEMLNKFHTDLQLAPAQPVVAPVPATAPEAGAVRVPYVSKTVKQEIVDQVKTEVMAQAKDEHWAAPNTFPEWVSNIHVFGDVRFRDEGRFFNKNNELAFVDVNAINNGSPYNAGSNNNVLPPILNSTTDRNFLRIRARLGVEANLGDGFSATIRVASGDSNSPVSTNQTLGGYFQKSGIWLNQAFIKYEPRQGDAIIFGRMPNPFVKTELVWHDEVNLDGLAVKARYDLPTLATAPWLADLDVHAVAGAFPLSYIPDNFPSNATSNQKVGQGANKWLFAGQFGAGYARNRLKINLDAAYYDYTNVQGDLSPACSNEAAYCLTDASRPLFMQKGNTLFALRDLTFPNSNDPSQPQYYGVASKFEVLDLIANVDFAATDKFHLILTGDYARNLAYSAKAIQALPIVNNNETCSISVPAGKTCASAGGTQVFKSGNDAWSLALQLGAPTIENRWDWNTGFTYKYLAPDSVVDAFTDSDFHLGGTNAKGWILAGNLGLAHNTWLTAKWLSADAVSGPTFAVDVLQVDLNTKF